MNIRATQSARESHISNYIMTESVGFSVESALLFSAGTDSDSVPFGDVPLSRVWAGVAQFSGRGVGLSRDPMKDPRFEPRSDGSTRKNCQSFSQSKMLC